MTTGIAVVLAIEEHITGSPERTPNDYQLH